MEAYNSLVESLNQESTLTRVAIILSLTLLISLVCKFVVSRMQGRTGKTATVWDEAFLDSIGLPLVVLVWAVGITMSLNIMLEAVESRHVKTSSFGGRDRSDS